jgi:WD40 repeat protein
VQRFSDHEDIVFDLAYSPDGLTAASVEFGALRLWDLATGTEIQRVELPARFWRVIYTPNGGTALLTPFDGGAVIQVDLTTGELIQRLGDEGKFAEHLGRVSGIEVSPDGRMALSGAMGEDITEESGQRTLALWDLESGELRMRLETGPVYSVDISPDGQTALSGGNYSLTLWDLESGEAIRQIEGHNNLVWDVVYSPDGKSALSGSWDSSLILWDLQSGEIIHRLLGHSDIVRAVAISSDGKLGVSGSRDGTLILWDLESGEAIRRYRGHNGTVNSVAFSPDGSKVLSGAADGVMIEWRVDATLEELTAWTQANRYLYDLSCSERAQYGVEPLCEED